MEIGRATVGSLCGAVLFLVLAGPTSAREDMSGTWREEYTETVYSIEQWSPACDEAPRTTGRRKRGLEFTVEDRGIDLKFKGRRGSFSTGDCLTSNKAVKPRERTVKDKLFMISCSTQENTDLYENGLYSFRIKSPKRIEYKETTRFSRNVTGSMCVHTRRVRRLYVKVADKTADSAPARPVPKPQPPPPKPHDPCMRPGPPVSVSFEPSRAKVGQGASLCIEVNATDTNGCTLKARLGWSKGRRPRDITLTPKGCLRVSARARPGKRTLRLAAGGVETELALTVTRKVASARPGPRQRPDTGTKPPAVEPEKEPTSPVEEPEPAEPVDAGVQPEPEPAGTPEYEPPDWVLPVGIGGGVLVLALIALVIVLALRKPPAAEAPPDPSPATAFCTNCGSKMPEGAKFCPFCQHKLG